MAMQERVDAAVARAMNDAQQPSLGGPDGRGRTRHRVVGDPQAPLRTFLNVLDHHGLLGDDGRLLPEVGLVSIGDHFDYGKPEQRVAATQEATALLSWLAAHPSDQVTLILGNHDLARVGELRGFDDATYRRARDEADLAYQRGSTDEAKEAAFIAKWPQFPGAELAARDFSCFEQRQETLVEKLLRSGRFRIAHAHQNKLMIHAGITVDEFPLLGLSESASAEQVDAALHAFLQKKVAAWGREPLALDVLHRPGTAATGEGRGIFFHRPADPSISTPEQLAGPPRRRFDPHRLPTGFTQVIGHIRDNKCRTLLSRWVVPGEVAKDGPLRSLTRVPGTDFRYRRGLDDGAAIWFTDGGMSHAKLEDYQLLDLDRNAPAETSPSL